jgi:hypothetical protein
VNLHSKAVDAAIEAAGPRLNAADQPLLELARTLPQQVDAAGPDGPGSRLVASYATVVRALSTRLAALVDAPSAMSALARLRAEHSCEWQRSSQRPEQMNHPRKG